MHIVNASNGIAFGVVARITQHRSRTHARAFEVQMEGNGSVASQYRTNTDGTKAATWDEWGVLIGRLYVLDPDAIWGGKANPIYQSAEHFHWETGNRFRPTRATLRSDQDGNTYTTQDVVLPADTHKRHKWEYSGDCVTGSYHIATCKGSKGKPCSAIRRYMAYGHEFSSISGTVKVGG
jgi:hypothetical protein